MSYFSTLQTQERVPLQSSPQPQIRYSVAPLQLQHPAAVDSQCCCSVAAV